MVNEQLIHSTIAAMKGSGKTFAEFLAEIFKDKFIEVYVGDAYEDVSTEQVSTTYPAVFCGKVVAAYRECLILNCAFANHTAKKYQMGNFLFVNERAIRALNEVDGNGTVEEMMVRGKETFAIKQLFNKGRSNK